MDNFKTRLKTILEAQEVRISAALQLVLCVLALTAAEKKELRTSKKKRRKKK